MRRWIALLMLVAACGGATVDATGTTAPPGDTEPVSEVVVPRQLEGLGVLRLDVGGRELVVALADNAVERATGLMFVTDLDDLDGMVFWYGSDTSTLFHMENTLIPLDIAFFAADGSFVSKTTMTPCTTDDCPTYAAEGRYRYAIEVPAGAFDWVDASTRLDVTPLAD